jgi:hypothetical protein
MNGEEPLIEDGDIEVECPTCGSLCVDTKGGFEPIAREENDAWRAYSSFMAGAAVAFGLMGMADSIDARAAWCADCQRHTLDCVCPYTGPRPDQVVGPRPAHASPARSEKGER